MFKTMVEILRRQTELEQMENEFFSMLSTAQEMFDEITGCFEREGVEEHPATIHEKDERIRKLQQRLCRSVYSYVLKSSGENLSLALAFVRIVSDAERVDDYIMNIHGALEQAATWKFHESEKAALAEQRKNILKLFGEIIPALKNRDADKARDLADKTKSDRMVCEKLIYALVAGDKEAIESNNPVAAALVFRFQKRILAHLANIATAVYMPIGKIDFFNETHAR